MLEKKDIMNIVQSLQKRQLTDEQKATWFIVTAIADFVGMCILPAVAIIIHLNCSVYKYGRNYSDFETIIIGLCAFGFMVTLANQIAYVVFTKERPDGKDDG